MIYRPISLLDISDSFVENFSYIGQWRFCVKSVSKNRQTLSRFIVIEMYSALTELTGFTREIKLRDRRARPQAEVEFSREARAGVKTIVEFITE